VNNACNPHREHFWIHWSKSWAWTPSLLVYLHVIHRTLDVGRWTLDIGRRTSDVESWTLDIGHWTSDIGHWTSDIGHWTSDVGHWTLNVGISNYGNQLLLLLYSLTTGVLFLSALFKVVVTLKRLKGGGWGIMFWNEMSTINLGMKGKGKDSRPKR